jgi:hypothetical protein
MESLTRHQKVQVLVHLLIGKQQAVVSGLWLSVDSLTDLPAVFPGAMR